jgi:hypothetical protein
MMFTRLTAAVLVAASCSAIAVAGSVTPAAAAATRLSMAGVGSASVPATGAATYTGHLSGSPLSGEFSGQLDPADGSLPGIGSCESASARVRVQDGRGRFVELLADGGRVCSILLPLGTMQAFDGRFRVVATSEHRLRRVEGALQVRLLGDQSDVYAIGG